VIAGCEGDVCSTLGMLWAKLMTGQVPWMANIAQVGHGCSADGESGERERGTGATEGMGTLL